MCHVMRNILYKKHEQKQCKKKDKKTKQKQTKQKQKQNKNKTCFWIHHQQR